MLDTVLWQLKKSISIQFLFKPLLYIILSKTIQSSTNRPAKLYTICSTSLSLSNSDSTVWKYFSEFEFVKQMVFN